MIHLLLGTHFVSLDEAAYSLKETNGPSADSKSVRRWQTIKVVRQDAIAEYRRDLGAAVAFSADEFIIPGGVFDPRTGRGALLHTVGELVDIAERLRGRAWVPEPTPEPSNLIQQYKDLPDQRRRARRRLSQFGPVARIQRS